MAAIWIDSNCGKCGKPLENGGKAILVATVKTTKRSAYGNWTADGSSKVRVNFFSGSARELIHIECF